MLLSDNYNNHKDFFLTDTISLLRKFYKGLKRLGINDLSAIIIRVENTIIIV